MKIAGIIAEYNPFHNGHAHHLNETRARTGSDAVIAVMSGNFMQRGEPAAFDKWARTRMALGCGIDAVFELPTMYALQSADWFANGGVAVLNGLGLDCLSFGSELPDLEGLTRLSSLWDDEPEEIKAAIRQGMDAGKPHPKARAEALERWLGQDGAAQALATPNSVLGAMYLRSLKGLTSTIEPIAVPRIEAAYNDEDIIGSIASATAVRRALATGSHEWRRAVPETVAAIIDEEAAREAGPVGVDDLGQMLLYALRRGGGLPDAAEGLDNRMRRAAFAVGSAEEFFAAVKCKRYTMARIKRAAMQALLGVMATDLELIRQEKPVYARLLGYTRRVEGLVNELARRASIPFIARPADFSPGSPAEERLWQADLDASDVYALTKKNPALRQGKRDYTEKLIVM